MSQDTKQNTKKADNKNQTPKPQPRPNGRFGYFDKMHSNKTRYTEKPQPALPYSGRNGQGKPS